MHAGEIVFHLLIPFAILATIVTAAYYVVMLVFEILKLK